MRAWSLLLVLLGASACSSKARLEIFDPQSGAPIAAGSKVKVARGIAFRVTLPKDECVQIFQQNVALFGEPQCLTAGTHVIKQYGEPAVLELEEAGQFEFFVAPGNDKVPLDVVP
jgi:hypothetical protein